MTNIIPASTNFSRTVVYSALPASQFTMLAFMDQAYKEDVGLGLHYSPVLLKQSFKDTNITPHVHDDSKITFFSTLFVSSMGRLCTHGDV